VNGKRIIIKHSQFSMLTALVPASGWVGLRVLVTGSRGSASYSADYRALRLLAQAGLIEVTGGHFKAARLTPAGIAAWARRDPERLPPIPRGLRMRSPPAPGQIATPPAASASWPALTDQEPC
jgi:hypothetical protein